MKRNFAVLTAITAGIMFAAFLKLAAVVWLIALLGIICLICLFWAFYYSGWGWLLLAGVACFSGFYFSLLQGSYGEQLRWNQAFDCKTVMVQGAMVSRAEPINSGKTRFTIRINSGSAAMPRGRLTIYYSGIIPPEYYGRNLQLCGRFRSTAANNGTVPGFFERQRLTGRISVTEKPHLLPGSGLPPWYRWADRFRNRLMNFGKTSLTRDRYPLLQGMIFGEELPENAENLRLKEEFRRTGTIHLLSVSGLHVGFVVLGLNLLFSGLRLPRKWRIPLLALGVGFYIMMTGMKAPVFRAGVMLLIYLMAQWLNVREGPLNRLSLAGCCLLLINPYSLFDIGFQLSFAATLGVVWLYPLLKDYFPCKIKFLKPLYQLLLISVSAQVVLLPISVYYFQQISWGSPLANILLALPAEIVVVAGLAGEMLGLWVPALGQYLMILVGWNIHLIQWTVRFLASFPWVCSWSPSWPWPWICGYYLGLILILDRLKPNLLTGRRQLNRGTGIILMLIVSNCFIWGSFYFKLQSNYLEVDILDVGQGDAIFLRGPCGSTVLVDAGNNGFGQHRILPFLRQNGIEQLDMVFGTHGDSDHVGGMDEVLEGVRVGTCFLPESIGRQLKTVQQLFRTVKLRKTQLKFVTDGMCFRLDHEVTGEIMLASKMISENDRSLVLLIGYGKNKLLLTGDLGAEGEEIFLKKYPHKLRVSGLKAGHHGSDSSSSWPFLTQVQPDYAVISVGAGNCYGHPGQKALSRLHSIGARVFRTDRHGVVHLRLYPDKTIVIPSKVDFDDTQ